MIRIIGAKGDIENTDQFLKKINDLSKKHKIVIQVLDANMVYGKKHLISASRHAIRAIRRKKILRILCQWKYSYMPREKD
ncbi:MAG: hypothetical protein DRN08_05495, partial [Thermoplasmata archaeon]